MKKAIINKTAPAVPIADVPIFKREAKFVFRVTESEDTYLRVGYVVGFEGRDHVVISISPSSARIVPITEGTPKQVTFKPKFADKPITFSAPERNSVVSISVNSELPIKRRLGVNWRERL